MFRESTGHGDPNSCCVCAGGDRDGGGGTVDVAGAEEEGSQGGSTGERQ